MNRREERKGVRVGGKGLSTVSKKTKSAESSSYGGAKDGKCAFSMAVDKAVYDLKYGELQDTSTMLTPTTLWPIES